MNVHPGLLAASAAAAAAQSQTVLAAHNTAATSVDAAMSGWVGSSRTALTATAHRWAEVSAGLNLRIHQHSEALRISGLTFAEMDAHHSRRLSGIRAPEPE
jgi:uncharacterized protein YukE